MKAAAKNSATSPTNTNSKMRSSGLEDEDDGKSPMQEMS